MAQAITLARPYARAAFELAQESASLDAWSAWLQFAATVSLDARVHALLNDPRVMPTQLTELLLPVEQPLESAFGAFLLALAGKRRLALLPEMCELYEAYKREALSLLLVKVTSAMALDAAQAEQLKASLKQRFKRDIELETTVDASLLGGVIIDTGSEVIDGSARGRLARLSSALTH